MSDGDALLQAILRFPEDDTPRMIYADRLDEIAGDVVCPRCSGEGCSAHSIAANGPCKSVSDGRRGRAEFIRVQVELARPTGHGYADCVAPFRCDECLRYDELRRRERELLEAHRSTWTNIVPGYTIDAWSLDEPMLPYVYGARCQFRRGFVSRITLPISVFTEDVARAIFSTQPVTEVVFTEANAAYGEIGWICDSEEEISNRDERLDILPRELFYRLGSGSLQSDSVEWRRYTDAVTALNDLQQAAVSWGRELAGLPPLPRNDTAAGKHPAAGRHDGPAA